MSVRNGYKGVGLQTVDDKSRVALPSGLRVLIERNLGVAAETRDGRVLTITTHEIDPCLMAYEEPYFDEMARDVEARALAHARANGAKNDRIIREGQGVPENANFDANGRFVMPAFHKEHARITRHAFFYGRPDGIEIWDPKTLLDYADAPAVLKAACEFHLKRLKVAP